MNMNGKVISTLPLGAGKRIWRMTLDTHMPTAGVVKVSSRVRTRLTRPVVATVQPRRRVPLRPGLIIRLRS